LVLTVVLIVVGLFVVVVAALLGFAATKPDAFRVQRSASIKAPAEKIFALINDFHRWGSWSPWEKLDPALKRTYSGAANGQGAVYEWEGNKKVGKGRMEITQTSPPSKVTIKLDFLKPFEAHNTAEFTLDGQGDSTNVTWTMDGQQPYMFKVMTLFLSMDKMVGKDFETGLANLKSITESKP
jgi:carbon monoxide dehydrogenase subunit G